MAETEFHDEKTGAKSHSLKPHRRYSNQFFQKNIYEHRKVVESASPHIAPADVDCIEESIKIGRVELQVARFIPKGKSNRKLPTTFFVDGTAFVANGLKFSKTIASHLCFRSKKQIILIFAPLSPEYTVIQSKKYVARLVDFLYANAGNYQIDKNNLSLIGYSSGASFVDTIDTLCGRNGMHFNKKVFVSPLMDLTGNTEKDPKYRAYAKNAKLDTQISRQFIDYFVNLAVPKEDRTKPIVSPMWQKRSTETVTEIIVGEHDRLLQQSIALRDHRASKGVNISLIIVQDGTHAMFWRQFATVYLAADRTNNEIMEGEHSVQLEENSLNYKIINPQSRLSS